MHHIEWRSEEEYAQIFDMITEKARDYVQEGVSKSKYDKDLGLAAAEGLKPLIEAYFGSEFAIPEFTHRSADRIQRNRKFLRSITDPDWPRPTGVGLLYSSERSEGEDGEVGDEESRRPLGRSHVRWCRDDKDGILMLLSIRVSDTHITDVQDEEGEFGPDQIYISVEAGTNLPPDTPTERMQSAISPMAYELVEFVVNSTSIKDVSERFVVDAGTAPSISPITF